MLVPKPTNVTPLSKAKHAENLDFRDDYNGESMNGNNA